MTAARSRAHGRARQTQQRAVPTEAAFSCKTEVEQHPQRKEEPYNRNSEPPAILLCHESPRSSLPQIGAGMIAFRFRENCVLHHVPSRPRPLLESGKDTPAGGAFPRPDDQEGTRGSVPRVRPSEFRPAAVTSRRRKSNNVSIAEPTPRFQIATAPEIEPAVARESRRRNARRLSSLECAGLRSRAAPLDCRKL
jgi:hypothetical protein